MGKTYILIMGFKGFSFLFYTMVGIFSSALLISCTVNETAGNLSASVRYCGANSSMPLMRHALKWTMTPDRDQIYILDDFSGISHWVLAPTSCSWELDRSFGADGVEHMTGFADDLLWSGSELWVQSGRILEGFESHSSCQISDSGPFFMDANRVAVGSSLGVQIYNLVNGQCSPITSFGGIEVSALTGNPSLLILGERVLSDRSMSIWAYSWQGSLQWVYQQSSGGPLCSMDRLVMDHGNVLALDATCGQVGIFNSRGDSLATLDLSDLGIRGRVLDIAPGALGQFWLLMSGTPMTYLVSYSAVIGGS